MSTVTETNTTATATAGTQTAQSQPGDTRSASASPSTAPARRMLFRHPSDKLVAGVCAGIAESLNWNPVIVRVIFVVATFATWGGGILAYILLAMFLPTGTNTVGQMKPPAVELSQKGMTWAAALLMGLGGFWLLANLGILPGIWRIFWGLVAVLFWPALLIGAGYLLLRANSDKDIDKELTGAARKFKDRFGDKLPSGDQVRSGFTAMRNRMPLRRSNTNKMFMGVCGGLAEKFDVDANLSRLIWGAFALGTMGMGALLYLVVGLLLPEGAPLAMSANVNGNGASAEKVQRITVVDGSAQRVN